LWRCIAKATSQVTIPGASQWDDRCDHMARTIFEQMSLHELFSCFKDNHVEWEGFLQAMKIRKSAGSEAA
jgi:hypothetical protein